MNPAPSRLRSLALLLGALVLIWIPLEGQHSLTALALGAGVSVLLVLHLGSHWPTLARSLQQLSPIWRSALLGTIAGGAAPLFAVGLMALKTGLHGHATPDFTGQQVAAMLALCPWLLAAGALAGMAVGWFNQYRG